MNHQNSLYDHAREVDASGFPVFCSAPASCLHLPLLGQLAGPHALCEGESLAPGQMQVPGCAGGCCFRFLTAPDFSLYTIGIC
ncbi:hypothetical protein I79_005026 [Cricetulus griseus]|uniref:Uncharacterized protein n=1 Tax=Cricetulus griseus TaxID=10029 RepID=G3H431_CRIGR|nr:hypothetical protein I79_005026 [Cricetulus griseus]